MKKEKVYLAGEEWRDVVGYEGFYQVSSHGRVRSVDRIIHNVGHGYSRKYKGRIKSPSLNTKGYPKVLLSKNGVDNTHKIHRLVAQAFIPNPNRLPQVDHIDGIKTNNHVSNLEWVTNQENHNRKMTMGLNVNKKGESHGQAKLSNIDVMSIYRELISGAKQKDLAEKYNVSKHTICAIKCKRNWRELTDKLDMEVI